MFQLPSEDLEKVVTFCWLVEGTRKGVCSTTPNPRRSERPAILLLGHHGTCTPMGGRESHALCILMTLQVFFRLLSEPLVLLSLWLFHLAIREKKVRSFRLLFSNDMSRCYMRLCASVMALCPCICALVSILALCPWICSS